MYIKSDYKDQFLDFIRTAHLSPISVRNIVSDTNSFFTWLSAYNFEIEIDKIYATYVRHLTRNGTAIHTMNRKLSSLNKFISWVRSEHPPVSVTHQTTIHSDVPIERSHLRRPWFFRGILSVSCLILAILIIIASYIYHTRSAGNTHSKFTPLNMRSANDRYLIQFNLNFSSRFDLSMKPGTVFMFKFFSMKNQNTSIGYVECPFNQSMLTEGLSRLKIKIDQNCSPLSDVVYDAVDSGEAIFADIYINNIKLTQSKVVLSITQSAEVKSNHQNMIKDLSDKAGNIDDQLPNFVESGPVLGSETVIPTGLTSGSIPLSMFRNVPPFEDGDIVSIYNNELVRALLSTKVLGIKSSDHIITQGIAHIHVLNTPERPITIGDYISTSTTPGYGQKATTKNETIVGVALESSLPTKNYIEVLLTTH